MEQQQTLGEDGLSPRVRGNHSSPSPCGYSERSIPACAGEPPPGERSREKCRVYPRVCGGTIAKPTLVPISTGLSPRVRGNQPHRHCLGRHLRSIPACAGEPVRGSQRRHRNTVYPRVCGGTVRCFNPLVRTTGLSPRVRGNPSSSSPFATGLGSIPACAGEPRMAGHSTARTGVYPRVCGGTFFLFEYSQSITGLSPRVRGNLPGPLHKVVYIGSIPACAGEPSMKRNCRHLRTVYPRVCGGTIPRPVPSVGVQGLSPRVRGNLCLDGANLLYNRSIPACAGEPLGLGTRIWLHTVYPRVCGGTVRPFVGVR